MDDRLGTEVARKLYHHLFKDPSKSLNPDLVAFALDEAVQELQTPRGGHYPPASTWAPFIHLGI